MTREQRIAKARRLRERGLSYQRIADQVGVKHGHTVLKWLNPDKAARWTRNDNAKRQEAKNAWQRAVDHSPAGRALCSRCGGLAGVGSRRSHVEVCSECRSYEAVQKAVKVERLWLEGKTFPEICAAMGWSRGMLARMMAVYRDEGYDLPYRKIGPRQPGKYAELRPERVAA